MSCYEKHVTGVGCGKHVPGTMGSFIGKLILGLPTGFNRTGNVDGFIPTIFPEFKDCYGYDKYTVPVWKHLNEQGHTLVRGILPRLNMPFLHIFLEDCRDKINCLEITAEDLSEMD